MLNNFINYLKFLNIMISNLSFDFVIQYIRIKEWSSYFFKIEYLLKALLCGLIDSTLISWSSFDQNIELNKNHYPFTKIITAMMTIFNRFYHMGNYHMETFLGEE
jgi:hypothetical protein